MTLSIAVASQNTLVATYGAYMNAANLVLCSGTAPATCDTAFSGNVVLAALPFSATAFGAAAAGSITANTITQENAYTTGTASFYRVAVNSSSINATAMVANTMYVINVPGSTTWATYGSSGSTAGTVFIANGAGTGSGTCYQVTFVEQGAVGTSGQDLNLNTTSIVAAGPVNVTSFIRTI